MHFCDTSTCQLCQQGSVSVLGKVGPEYIEAINDQKVVNTYKKGQTIFNEGSYPFGIYCICNGKIKLSHLGDDGKEQIVRLLKGGDIVGHRALLSGDRFAASAVALEETSVCFIPKDLFIKILKNNPKFSYEMMKLLSDELHQAEIKLIHLAQKPVRERLAETLLFIKSVYGYEKDGITLNVRLSREEIANLVGTATESAIRLLSEFRREGMVELDGKKIKITNSAELLKTANLQD